MKPQTPASGNAPSILLLLPYFGPLPSGARLFFRSCAENPTINWLVVTDQPLDKSRLPPNVAVKHTTFAALKQSIDSVLGMTTAVPTPYKLSDLRPAYGLIFSSEISGFEWWGHCDMDLMFGDIRKFITAEILASHLKVLIHGHLSLYRNCDEANHFFELEAPGVSFRDACTSSTPTAFDEFGGMKPLLEHHKIPIFRDDSYLADIDRNVYRMEIVWAHNYDHQCFYWERGRVFRAFWDGGKPARQEYVYCHFQQRPMTVPAEDLSQTDAWYITPGGFVAKHSDPEGPAEMDRLNQRNVWFNLKRHVCTLTWHARRNIVRAIAPRIRPHEWSRSS